MINDNSGCKLVPTVIFLNARAAEESFQDGSPLKYKDDNGFIDDMSAIFHDFLMLLAWISNLNPVFIVLFKFHIIQTG